MLMRLPRPNVLRQSFQIRSLNIWDKFKSSIDFPAASHEIKKLGSAERLRLLGKSVVLHGYLQSRSDTSKSLSFARLLSSDLKTSVQIISRDADSPQAAVHLRFKSLGIHAPVAVKGIVQEKVQPKKRRASSGIHQVNDVEIDLVEIHLLNEFPADLVLKEETRFKSHQRHLQIRSQRHLRDALEFRAKASSLCRKCLGDEGGFLEISTPLLFKSTPEGAREFLIPTRVLGKAYALPQSPQQYKQILMSSGISKYFQFATCFRDEDLRADRQPEFTQLDLEMSFATGKDVKKTIEVLIQRLWHDLLGITLADGPFLEMSYIEAMEKYGSDKPDTRIGMEISRVDHMLPVDLLAKLGPLTEPIVEVMKLSLHEGNPQTTRQFVTDFMESPAAHPFLENPHGQPGIFIVDSSRPLQGLQPFGFEAAEILQSSMALEDGDLVLLQAREALPHFGGSTPLGNLRVAMHSIAVERELLPKPEGFSFRWITEFPLFSPSNDIDPGQGGMAGISATHHPFTAPATSHDAELLFTDPTSAKADHYDLIVNGVELGGGSRRIHVADIQEMVLRDVLKMTSDRLADFAHLIEALRAGCPPHAGIALGFDRLIAVMLGRKSIRDVIAFPKTGSGEDPLVKSPSVITQEQWTELGLKRIN